MNNSPLGKAPSMNPSAAKEAEVVAEIQSLHSIVEGLEGVTERLHGKLIAVKSVSSDKNVGSATPSIQRSAPLADELSVLIGRLKGVYESLDNLWMRIEL